MEGKRLIHSLSLRNLLSFGNEGVEVELQPLNVLIGPNGSGKSNFLEAIRLLKATPKDLTTPISDGGGIEAWIWKGPKSRFKSQQLLEVEATVRIFIHIKGVEVTLHHKLAFLPINSRMQLLSEKIEETLSQKGKSPTPLYSFPDGAIYGLDTISKEYIRRQIPAEQLKYNQSILSQRNDPDIYTEIASLANLYRDIQLYTDVSFGRLTPARKPQQTDLDSTYLFEDYSNLALILNDLQNRPGVMKTILEKLKLFYDRVENIITRVNFGTVQLYFEERGLQHTIPATRLSDGTLRFLCLLVILCHPEPPPLVCIEEPELGMHPDIIPTIADLLIEASQRTQLIVTTHSDLLVSCLSHIPEAIVVCERDEGGTRMERLDPDKLKLWLEKYELGELWMKGQIGGKRW